MTLDDQIAARLQTALAVELSPDQVRRLDARVEGARTQPGSRHWPAMARLRWFVRPVPLLAALALISGSVIGAASLLDQLMESQGAPGWQAAWDKAQIVNLEQTDGDVTITLVRAYADRNQVLVGFNVTGLPGARTSDGGDPSPLEWTAGLTDPTGQTAETWATVRTGLETRRADASASIQTWEGPVGSKAGTWILTFTSIGYGGGAWTPGECDVDSLDPACSDLQANRMVEGTWRFEFDLPAPTGMVLTPEIAVAEGAATLTLTELRIAPTMVRAGVALRVDGAVVSAWGSTEQTATIRRDDASYPFTTESHVTQAVEDRGPLGDENAFLNAAGPSTGSGTWVIEFPEIWYTSEGDGTVVRLSGPWTFTVDVP